MGTPCTLPHLEYPLPFIIPAFSSSQSAAISLESSQCLGTDGMRVTLCRQPTYQAKDYFCPSPASRRQPPPGGFTRGARQDGTACEHLAAGRATDAVVGPFPRKRRGRLSLPLRRPLIIRLSGCFSSEKRTP
ncbi:hypothetical protein JDV02_008404 [Purpureocillium takamizusanense]|uniref:Uncharacterized protein n=1 Tax=Purpureocillium takamizusanense TaxID=2060973 RepID=A0A9Q8QMQ5_9HYPO|nr:uncharacterized protein JDV02_008404 [Purpureocillium takamizusanense]UNI22523.1 hypothetical protein JDV02_008404 [Purpureocillium takamizusanense]